MATMDENEPTRLAGKTGIDQQPPAGDPVRVTLTRTESTATSDQSLWTAIRATTDALAFPNYSKFLDAVLCGGDGPDQRAVHDLRMRRGSPFPGVDAYLVVKAATEIFVMGHCGVRTPDGQFVPFEINAAEESARYDRVVDGPEIRREFAEYTRTGHGHILPYLELIRARLGDVPLRDSRDKYLGLQCYGMLRERLVHPCFLELLWSYWHEEGMLVQTLNAISLRFQNRRIGADRDPLANLAIDPLRPLNNLLWGYLQDEQHRLTVQRRAHEYDHQYGLPLLGKAIPVLRTADSRSRFLDAFHRLLHVCSEFYKQDDDTTVIADGFPVLNGLKEVHLLLAEGADNQYGDLPSTARVEMLMQQWLLARPEMREFLGGRIMVPYPEPWMDRVDAMKALQGWSDTPVLYFRDLGVYGEQILLGIRFGAWSTVVDRARAANWARYFRIEICAYLHAYRAVTGVDIRKGGEIDATPPSIHLRNRLASQARRR
jgi:hypothetical protein